MSADTPQPSTDPLADLTLDEKRVLVELAQKKVNGGGRAKVGRRELLEGAGLFGLGSLLGGGAAVGLTGQAAAAPTGEMGTAATPLSKVHAAELTGGGSAIDVSDNLLPATDGTEQLGSATKAWGAVTTERLSTAARDPTVVVHKVDGTAVVDGPDGEISYSGGDAAAIQAAFDNLTSGRDWTESVKCKGDFAIDTQITVPSFGVLDLYDAKLTNGGGITNGNAVVSVGSSGSETKDAHVMGGVIDGDRQNTANTIRGLHIQGNYPDTEERSTVRDLYITGCENEGLEEDLRRVVIRDVEVMDSGAGVTYGVVLRGTDLTTYNLLAKDNIGSGIKIFAAWSSHYYMTAARNQGAGVSHSGARSSFYHGLSENNDDDGFVIDLGDSGVGPVSVSLHDWYSLNNGQDSGEVGVGYLISSAEQVLLDHCYAFDSQGTSTQAASVFISSGVTDVDLVDFDDSENPSGINNNGTRIRWDGVIGGGPLGGVDIGAATGAEDGDWAEADGTDASATAGELFRFDGTDWQSVADPSTTITPS